MKITALLSTAFTGMLPVVLTYDALGQSGRIEWGTISSAALAGSLFHDPTDRPYAVYLPPGYAQGQQRYPVFYLLHGWGGNPESHLEEMQSTLDSLIRTRQIGEMMAVFVDGSNALHGSFYRTSTVTGDYETYLVRDLVNHIDTHYRTLATQASRGITGFSMGGYGALHLAFHYPDSFSVVVSQCGYYDTTDAASDTALKQIARAKPLTPEAIASLPLRAMALFPFLPSAVPNPSLPPFYYDAPYTFSNGQFTTNETAVQRLREADILHGAVGNLLEQTANLRGIKLIHGAADPLVPVSQAHSVHQALLNGGVSHVYEEHAGGHEFHPHRSLTFLSENLVGMERYILPPQLILTLTGSNAEMEFSTQSGVDYQIERTGHLDAATLQWNHVERVKGTGQVVRIAMPVNTDGGFFRVNASNSTTP